MFPCASFMGTKTCHSGERVCFGHVYETLARTNKGKQYEKITHLGILSIPAKYVLTMCF